MSELLEKLNNLSTPKKVIALSAACVFLFWMGYTDEIFPAQEELDAANFSSTRIEKEIDQLQEINKSLVTINEELRRAEEDMSSLKTILPEEPKIEELLASLSASAKAAGVTIVSFQPKKLEKKKNVIAEGDRESGQDQVSRNANSPTNSSNNDQKSEDLKPGQASKTSQPEPSDSFKENVAFETLIAVTLTGTFAQIVGFFDRTLQIDRVLHLENFKIDLKKGEEANFSGTRVLSASAEFIAYSQKGVEILIASDLSEDPYGIKARKENALRDESLLLSDEKKLK